MASNRTFEDLDLSKDEVKRLGEALRDEKFRKMLVEYAEEISNPENKRKAEEEISIMEKERGMNIQFIHPEPGYVLKTTVDGVKKTFINICQNDKIEKPKAKKQTGLDGKRGVMWQIPHSFAPPRDDNDKAQQVCKVFDVVFHPDTYRMAMSNDRFKKLVEDTAVEGIESQFGVTLDKKNIKRPKMKFKGVPQATVIRERLTHTDDNKTTETEDPDDILSKMPYPYDNKTSAEKTKENQLKHANRKANKSSNEKDKVNSDDSKFTIPKYTITHLSEIDMSEYRNAPDAKTSTCPKKLVIKIELPLLNSASQASLDIFEKKLILESVTPAAYKLDLSLPYHVNENEGSAKFDKSKRTLTVTLPVLPPKTPPLPFSMGTTASDETTTSKCDSTLIEDLSVSSVTDHTVNNNINSECSIQVDQIIVNTNEVVQKTIESDGLNCNKKIPFPQNVKWVLPNHLFSQDSETVSFVINVKNVEENTVKMSFPQSSAAMIQFMSIGAGCFPVYYKLYVQFPQGCSISSEHCSVDVSDNNLVFIILKDKKCRGFWDSFSTGIDDTQLEEKQFLTESNLQKELSDLDKEALEEASMPGQVETPELSVVEMSEKRLTIDIKPPKSKKWKLPDNTEEEDEEYDPPLSADIEVIHKHPLPDLHSILKQRSMSESSEEVSNVDPDSPRSEGEELSPSFSKKRSVSFSSHVDHASFKSSASVSSMTPGLKSKRRRQRKREEKRKGQVRCNSESSSEECMHSVSDSYSPSEEEGDSVSRKLKGGKNVVLRRALSDPGPHSEGLSTTEREKGSGEPGKKKGRKNKSSGGGNSNTLVPISKDVFDFRTKKLASGETVSVNGSKGKNDSQDKGLDIDFQKQVHICDEGDGDNKVNEKERKLGTKEMKALDRNKKIISEIKDRLAEEHDTEKTNGLKEDSDDDDFVDAVSSLAEELKTKFECSESVRTQSNELVNDIDETKEGSLSKPHIEDKMSLIEEIKPGAVNDHVSGTGRSKCDQNGIEQEKSDVKTVLSWEEGEVSSEHVTVCALQFSNSVMFDLDLE